MRQMHHWACDIFVGAIVIHMAPRLLHRCLPQAARTELDRRLDAVDPGDRERLPGYSLPDDLVSGTGIRIAYSIILSIPLVGSYLASGIRGQLPGHDDHFRASSSCTA